MSSDPATPVPSFQDAVVRLQAFWAARGCLLLPACDLGVPYATLVPDAFFHLLGPEPWRSACLQPLRRPLDGRGGEHPYRLFRHLQLQVVLKPVPADVQGLYLESLAALGLELALHDVRFSEWRWEPVSVGARGSGWRVRLDGLGVARITFFERLADRDLAPPSVEVSYGLERLMMALLGTASALDVAFSPGGPSYGALRRREEEELSRYAGEVAGEADLRRRLEALDQEAERCLSAGLPRPGYELAIRCLEPLDLLEARGVVSARERAGWLARVRQRVAAAADLQETAEKAAWRDAARHTAKARPRRPAKAAAKAKKAATRKAAAKAKETAGKATGKATQATKAPARKPKARKAKSRKQRPRKAPGGASPSGTKGGG